MVRDTNVKTFNYIDDFKSHKRINFNDKDKDNPIYADTNIDGDNKISDFTDAKIYVTPIFTNTKRHKYRCIIHERWC